MDGSADRVEVKIYDTGFLLVGTAESGPCASGWVHVNLPLEWLDSARNGRYFLRATAYSGAAQSAAVRPAKIVLLR